MLLIHESNFKNKINSNYKGLGEIIEDFYLNEYLKTKTELLEIDFSKADTETFKRGRLKDKPKIYRSIKKAL